MHAYPPRWVHVVDAPLNNKGRVDLPLLKIGMLSCPIGDNRQVDLPSNKTWAGSRPRGHREKTEPRDEEGYGDCLYSRKKHFFSSQPKTRFWVRTSVYSSIQQHTAEPYSPVQLAPIWLLKWREKVTRSALLAGVIVYAWLIRLGSLSWLFRRFGCCFALALAAN